MSSLTPPIALPHPQPALPTDERPNIDHLVTEDGAPVDNVYSERQMGLLEDARYDSWSGPGPDRPFLALANVGMFFSVEEPPLVPDLLLSLDVRPRQDLMKKESRSYFFWVYGKPPDAVVEIVSNKEGGEDDTKFKAYARLGISYCVIWDPFEYLKNGKLRIYGLDRGKYKLQASADLADIGLSLKTWHGEFKGIKTEWLRWYDSKGSVLLTGKEKAEQEKLRAEEALQRADAMAAKLRQLGVDPDA